MAKIIFLIKSAHFANIGPSVKGSGGYNFGKIKLLPLLEHVCAYLCGTKFQIYEKFYFSPITT